MFSHLYTDTDTHKQDGSSDDDTLKSIAVAGDGTFILAGYTSGDLGGPNAGETDLVAVKLSPDGDVVWRWQVRGKRGGDAALGTPSFT